MARNVFLSIAALTLLPCLDRAARADEPKDRVHRISVITAIHTPAGIPVGTRCGLALVAEKNDRNEVVETAYEGRVVKATEEGITLDVAKVRQETTSRSLFSRIPIMDEDRTGQFDWMVKQPPAFPVTLLSRSRRNVGIGETKPGQKAEVFIPSEKINRIDLSKANAL